MLNISIVLDLANDYSVNAGVFRDSGNFVKEYANLCSATALYLLALQSEQLDRDQRQELITKCESYIKLQEEIELTRFSFEEAIASSPEKKKRKRIPTFKKAAETSFKTEQEYLDSPGFQQQQLLQHASIINDPSIVDEKDVILAAQETHEYYSESDDSVDFNLVQQKSKSAKKKTLPKKSKIKTEPKTPGGSDHPIENVQLVQVVQDPVVVSAPDHFGYCEVTPTEEVSDGFYNFSAAQLKAFSERFKGKTHPDIEMRSLTGRKLGGNDLFGPCKDFLCSPESKIKEWFATLFQARMRAKALDPYGLMKNSSNTVKILDAHEGKSKGMGFSCIIPTCHAKLILRKVQPDSEGNNFGLYGCYEHQHELLDLPALEVKSNSKVKNSKTIFQGRGEIKIEIVFENWKAANDYFDQNFRVMYHTRSSDSRNNSSFHKCRRKFLKKGFGYHPCKSTISIVQTFVQSSFDKTLTGNEDKPYSLVGMMYHSHKKDERFHKKKGGRGFVRNHDDPTLDKPNKRGTEIRIKNGKLYPIYARKYVTIEEVLAARVGKGGHKRKKDKEKPPVVFKKGSAVVCYMIDLEERMRNSDP